MGGKNACFWKRLTLHSIKTVRIKEYSDIFSKLLQCWSISSLFSFFNIISSVPTWKRCDVPVNVFVVGIQHMVESHFYDTKHCWIFLIRAWSQAKLLLFSSSLMVFHSSRLIFNQRLCFLWASWFNKPGLKFSKNANRR